MIRCFLFGTVAAALAVGCAEQARPLAESVPFSGTAKFSDGTPVKNVFVRFFPTGPDQAPCGFPVNERGELVGLKGSAQPMTIAGKYKVCFVEDGDGTKDKAKFAAAIKTVPEEFRKEHAPKLEVVVAAGEKSEIVVPK